MLPLDVAKEVVNLLQYMLEEKPYDILKNAIIRHTNRSKIKHLHDLFNNLSLSKLITATPKNESSSKNKLHMQHILKNDLLKMCTLQHQTIHQWMEILTECRRAVNNSAPKYNEKKKQSSQNFTHY